MIGESKLKVSRSEGLPYAVAPAASLRYLGWIPTFEINRVLVTDQTRHATSMTSADFSLAQERVIARRRLREAEAQARLTEQQNSHASATVKRLPFPFSRAGRAGLQGWNSIKGREGTRPAFRVGQVDAELLDKELLDLLKAQVGEALKYFGVRGSLWQAAQQYELTSI